MASIKLNQSTVNVSNVFCIGRNYAAHIAELNNKPEDEPLVFLKPTSALIGLGEKIRLPEYSSDVHHECEMVVLIGKGGVDIPESEALSHIAGYGIGLDLTARDTQSVAKSKGLPWTKAKGFRSAACVSSFVPAEQLGNPQTVQFDLWVNGTLRQHADTSLMLFPVATIISYLSRIYGLTEGDLIFTGTPEGVARIVSGDSLSMSLQGGLISAEWVTA